MSQQNRIVWKKQSEVIISIIKPKTKWQQTKKYEKYYQTLCAAQLTFDTPAQAECERINHSGAYHSLAHCTDRHARKFRSTFGGCFGFLADCFWYLLVSPIKKITFRKVVEKKNTWRRRDLASFGHICNRTCVHAKWHNEIIIFESSNVLNSFLFFFESNIEVWECFFSQFRTVDPEIAVPLIIM